MKKYTCKGGKIKFKVGNEVKEYYATDIEVVGTTDEIREQVCDDCICEKPETKKKRKPKKTSVKVQHVDLDLEKGGDGTNGEAITDIDNR